MRDNDAGAAIILIKQLVFKSFTGHAQDSPKTPSPIFPSPQETSSCYLDGKLLKEHEAGRSLFKLTPKQFRISGKLHYLWQDVLLNVCIL